MATRKAFVGLSGPLFFDYQHHFLADASDPGPSPNPILDSPAALALLYDEVWFLCRALCPESMRGQPYVRYVLEDPAMRKRLAGFEMDESANDEFLEHARHHLRTPHLITDYDASVYGTGAKWWKTQGSAIDNHGYPLDLSPLKVRARSSNSMNISCVLFDQALVDHLGGRYELVVNACMQRVLAPGPSDGAADARSLAEEVSLTDAITLGRLPTRLTTAGPDTRYLEALRDSGCLPAFRAWIADYPSHVSPAELRDIEREVDDAIDTQLREFWRGFEPVEFTLSTCKTLVAEGLGFLLPPVGKALDGAKRFHEWRRLKAGRWSAFLAGAREQARPSPSGRPRLREK